MLKNLAEKARSLLPCLSLAALSGVLMGLAYPPFEINWLIWVALVPLLWVIVTADRKLHAFLAGFIAGFIFFIFVIQPLTSSQGWTGWLTDVAPGEREEIIGRQYYALQLLWFVLSAWGALFWGLFSVALAGLTRGSIFRLAVLAPPLAILITEWLRSITTWDYQWGFLGNAAIAFEPVAQIGALGGVWLLSWLVILVNVGVLSAFGLFRNPRSWPVPAGILAITTAVIVGGLWRSDSLETRLSELEDGVDVAAIQFIQEKTLRSNYTNLGLERAYLELMGLVARGDAGEIDLIVLPESVAVGALSIDSSTIPDVPRQIQWPLEHWQQAISRIMDQSRTEVDIIMGLDTISNQRLHNSLVFWDYGEIRTTYHKRRLVPFSEYQPRVLGLLGIQGRMQYNPGDSSRLASLQGIQIGGFICQEVQIPAVLRKSVRDGAELLVSGGNDGVFGSPAVASAHANMARLRAIENGRFIIRSMKTGISAIISPTGREISRTSTSDSTVLVDEVYALKGATIFVRFGDWPLVLALGVVLLFLKTSKVRNTK